MRTARFTIAALLAMTAGSAHTADDIESLDEDFLAYLAEFENAEDDWTIVEAAPPSKAATKEPAAQTPAKNTRPAPAPKAATSDDGSNP